MIEYQLAGLDLGEVRFAISPLNELALSLRTFRDPGRYPMHLRWLQLTAGRRRELDTEIILALTNRELWTPDFLTPRPYSPLTSLEEELALVARTPPAVVREDLADLHPDGDLPDVLRGRTSRVLARIVRALTDYWASCVEPWWPRMRALLEADVGHRGRTGARSGLSAMFADLSPRIRLVGDTLEVHMHSDVHFRRSTAGEGLTLVPTLFTRDASAPISPEEPPVVMYAARGIGTLWEADRPTSPAALDGLIGQVRSRLLVMLEAPASSTELARRLDVTPTAVNQHLRAMRAGGLLTSARHGRSVLYLRSELGDDLLRAAGSPTEQPA
jgi:DNA-binding transcriptional ArsR family regulator